MNSNPSPILRVSNLSKRFDMTQALKEVPLELFPGKIHALVGENGAGKSTLIKILTGIQQPDEGEMVFSGNGVLLSS